MWWWSWRLRMFVWSNKAFLCDLQLPLFCFGDHLALSLCVPEWVLNYSAVIMCVRKSVVCLCVNAVCVWLLGRRRCQMVAAKKMKKYNRHRLCCSSEGQSEWFGSAESFCWSFFYLSHMLHLKYVLSFLFKDCLYGNEWITPSCMCFCWPLPLCDERESVFSLVIHSLNQNAFMLFKCADMLLDQTLVNVPTPIFKFFKILTPMFEISTCQALTATTISERDGME